MYTKSRLLMLGTAALLGCAVLMAGPVKADDVTIKVRSMVSVQAQIKFYSQDRSHVWPSVSTAWNLDDYATHAYSLACISGEKICFGAWSVARDGYTGSLSWGVGHGDTRSCRSCCFICGEGPYQTQELIY